MTYPFQQHRPASRKQLKRRQMDCHHCGFRNAAFESRCEKCGRPLSIEMQPDGGGKAAGTRTGIDPEASQQIRREVRQRLEQYQARRNGMSLPLPFEEGEPENSDKVVPIPVRDPKPSPENPWTPKHIPAARPNAAQPTFYFDSGKSEDDSWRNVSVAPFRTRMLGLLRDAGWYLVGLTGFVAPIPLMTSWKGWEFPLLAGISIGAILLAALYGVIFLCYGSGTPGMRAEGLSLVRFDGTRPRMKQRVGRIVSAFVSAGSFFLGYLWAGLDEEKLYWHDHISRTFLTIEE